MANKTVISFVAVLFMALGTNAGQIDGNAVIGSMEGAGVGSTIGSSAGGRDGAIIGGGLGGALGAAVLIGGHRHFLGL